MPLVDVFRTIAKAGNEFKTLNIGAPWLTLFELLSLLEYEF